MKRTTAKPKIQLVIPLCLLILFAVSITVLGKTTPRTVTGAQPGNSEPPVPERILQTQKPHDCVFDICETVPATCECEGKIVYRCECGKEKEEPVPATGHVFEEKERKMATCTEAGYIRNQCGCGAESKTVLPKNDHDYVLVNTIAPTESWPGYEEWVCRMCGKKKTCNEAPPVPHTHRYEVVSTTPATCAKEGRTVSRCSCGDEKEQMIGKTAHSMRLQYVQKPTLTSGGYEEWKCENCGYAEKRNRTQPYPDASYTDLCTMIDLRMCANDFTPNREIGDQIVEIAQEGIASKTLISIAVSSDYMKTTKWMSHNLHGSLTYMIYTSVLEDRISTITLNGGGAATAFATLCEERDRLFTLEDVVIKELGINKTMTQREAIERINEWMCANLQYDYSYKSRTAMEMLEYRHGTCAAYAHLFRDLCSAIGIQVDYQAGENKEGSHAWNRVLFSDGSLYYVDTCWNDVRSVNHGTEMETDEKNGFSAEHVRALRTAYLMLDYSDFKMSHHDKYNVVNASNIPD